MTLIKIINVKKNYLDYTFNLTIKNKEKILISGSNGSGKSTLVKLIANYIKPDTGLIIFSSKLKISYLEEDESLPLNLRAGTYLKMILSLKGVNVNYKLKELFNIPLNKYIYELSKGNKRKLSLLITLSFKDELLILDEPLSGLDKKTAKGLIDYLKQVNNTLIIVSHFKDNFRDLKMKELNL